MSDPNTKERLYVISYDGISLYYKGDWTEIDFRSYEEANAHLDFLKSLSDEQVESWLELQKFMREHDRELQRKQQEIAPGT